MDIAEEAGFKPAACSCISFVVNFGVVGALIIICGTEVRTTGVMSCTCGISCTTPGGGICAFIFESNWWVFGGESRRGDEPLRRLKTNFDL